MEGWGQGSVSFLAGRMVIIGRVLREVAKGSHRMGFDFIELQVTNDMVSWPLDWVEVVLTRGRLSRDFHRDTAV